MKEPHFTTLFVPGTDAPFFRSLPAGPALIAIFAAQVMSIYAGPALFSLLSALLLTGCTAARRPVHRILIRAWPILILAALTAWRQADTYSWSAVLFFLRFCWMILAADLYVSSFGWQPMLAHAATGEATRSSNPFIAFFRHTIRITALTVWLTILQLPGILQSLQNRRLAAHARGLPRYRMLSAGAISSLLVTLVHDADSRAEAVQARGLGGDRSSPEHRSAGSRR